MPDRARLIGINHVALEVGDLDEALELYGRLFDFELRGRVRGMAFLDMGDQFLAIAEGRRQPRRRRPPLRARRRRQGGGPRRGRPRGPASALPGRRLDFFDPWGNRFEVVAYGDVQFDRVPGVKRKLGIEDLPKSDSAQKEIRDRGLA